MASEKTGPFAPFASCEPRGALDGLQSDPRPPGSIKLSGEDEVHRLRVGDYRILYTVHDDRLRVLVVKIGHRREIGTHELGYGTIRNLLTECRRELQKDAPRPEKDSRAA